MFLFNFYGLMVGNLERKEINKTKEECSIEDFRASRSKESQRVGKDKGIGFIFVDFSPVSSALFTAGGGGGGAGGGSGTAGARGVRQSLEFGPRRQCVVSERLEFFVPLVRESVLADRAFLCKQKTQEQKRIYFTFDQDLSARNFILKNVKISCSFPFFFAAVTLLGRWGFSWWMLRTSQTWVGKIFWSVIRSSDVFRSFQHSFSDNGFGVVTEMRPKLILSSSSCEYLLFGFVWFFSQSRRSANGSVD